MKNYKLKMWQYCKVCEIIGGLFHKIMSNIDYNCENIEEFKVLLENAKTFCESWGGLEFVNAPQSITENGYIWESNSGKKMEVVFEDSDNFNITIDEASNINSFIKEAINA